VISAKVVLILIWAICATVWELIFKQAYYSWVQSQGGVTGFGEVFLGYAGVGLVATLISAVIVRRLKRQDG